MHWYLYIILVLGICGGLKGLADSGAWWINENSLYIVVQYHISIEYTLSNKN